MRIKILLFFISVFLISIQIFAQENTANNDITGIITYSYDDKASGITKGDPIIGATILIKGTGKGTQSDVDGNFKIVGAPTGSVLVISYLGQTTQEIKIETGKTQYNVELKAESILIDEIVAVGYGEQKRTQITGSNVSVGEKDMKATINSGLDQALQGRAAGVTVSQTSGSPGAAASVNIRGIGSINGSQPLYVVDGVPIGYENLNMINPSDIETMEVLKDASAAAIYGARGANGVVLITTKKGKDGKGKIEFDAMVGVQDVWKKMNVLDKDQYLDYMRQIYSENNKPLPRPYEQTFSKDTINNNWSKDPKGTNWQDKILRQGRIENYNLAARGGNQYATYSISVGYFKNSGVLMNTNYERFSTRVNTEIKAKKWLKIGQNITFSRTNSTNADNTSGGNNPLPVIGFRGINDALNGSPLIPVYANENEPVLWGANRNTKIFGLNDMTNPVALNTVQNRTTTQTRFLGNVYAELNIGSFLGVGALEGLKFKTNVGADFYTSKSLDVNDPIIYPRYEVFTGVKTINDNRDNNFMWLVDNTLSYSKKINKHEFSALAGMSSQYFYTSNVGAGGTNYPASINTVGQAQDEVKIISGNDYDNSLLGYIGRINYAFNNKYLLTSNIRYDGSSRFGAKNKFGVFPSISVGWRISNENFMKSVLWISDLKVRVGYGLTGNQEIGNYKYTQVIVPGIIRYPLGSPDQTILAGNAPTLGLANPNLKWEASEQINFGVDFAILRNSIQLSVDYFEKNSKGMLVKTPIPATSGVTGFGSADAGSPSYLQNIGTVNNRGIEVMLTYRNEGGKFKFSLSPNGTFIWNNVTALAPGVDAIYDPNAISLTQVGQPIGSYYGYVTDGILQTTADGLNYAGNSTLAGNSFGKAQPGDYKFKDINLDGVINDKDRVIIGKPVPSFTYGFSGEARYLGFDIRVFLQGVQGVSIYNNQRKGLIGMSNGGPPDANQLTDVLNHWTPQNKSAELPRSAFGDPAGNNRDSNRWIEDGSYMRIKSLQIGYSFSEVMLKRLFRTDDGMSFRIYLQAQNLFTFTTYKGFDPEVGSFSATSAGVDGGTYPQPRTFSGGVQLSF